MRHALAKLAERPIAESLSPADPRRHASVTRRSRTVTRRPFGQRSLLGEEYRGPP